MRDRLPIRRFRFGSQAAIVALAWLANGHAQPRPRAADSHEIDVGRKRFTEGVAALKNGKFEEARVSFQQSYALKPVPAALRNLAAAELKTGRYLAAARHFTTYLKTTKPKEIDRPEVVQDGLAEAKSHCGMLLVETSVPGAEIGVDGESIGRTPLDADPWLVEPGERVITARLDGYEDHSERHLVEAGRTLSISIVLRPHGLILGPPPPPDMTTLASAESLASSPAVRTAHSSAPMHVAEPMSPLPADAPRVGVAPILIGGAITIAGLAAGIGYSAASSSNGQERDALLAKIPGPSPKCGIATPFAASCNEAQDLSEKSNTQQSLATAGFVVAGVAGAATLVYWLWPRTSRSQAVVAPAVAPAYAGIHWRSNF
jgi:hypothetical protein